jgi:hypothetical protein
VHIILTCILKLNACKEGTFSGSLDCPLYSGLTVVLESFLSFYLTIHTHFFHLVIHTRFVNYTITAKIKNIMDSQGNLKMCLLYKHLALIYRLKLYALFTIKWEK